MCHRLSVHTDLREALGKAPDPTAIVPLLKAAEEVHATHLSTSLCSTRSDHSILCSYAIFSLPPISLSLPLCCSFFSQKYPECCEKYAQFPTWYSRHSTFKKPWGAAESKSSSEKAKPPTERKSAFDDMECMAASLDNLFSGSSDTCESKEKIDC